MLNSETAEEEDAASVCHGSPATSKAKPQSPRLEIRIPRHGLIFAEFFYSFIYLFAVVVVFKEPDSEISGRMFGE